MKIRTIYEFYRFALKEIETIVGLRQYVDHPGAVAIIAVDDDGNVLMERNFRVEVGEELLEVPAGLVEAGEERIVTAKRELLEETGYVAKEWSELYTYYNSAGILNETTTVFLARGLEKRKTNLDESEKKTLRELVFMNPDLILDELIDNTKCKDSVVPVVALGLNKILKRK